MQGRSKTTFNMANLLGQPKNLYNLLYAEHTG